MSQRPPPTLGDLATIVWQRRRLAGMVTGILLVPGLAWVASQVRLYEASARLVVGESRKTVEFQRDGEGLREFALVNTYRELLESPGVLKSAVEASGAAAQAPYAGAAEPGAVLAARVRVLVNRDSWVLTIACKDEEPDRSERLLQALIDTLFARLRNQHHDHDNESGRFLLDQLAEARQRLAEANQREQEFRALTGVISSDPRENHAYVKMIELQRQRTDLDRRLTESQAQAAQITAAGRLPAAQRDETLQQLPGIAANPAVADQVQALRALREKKAQLGEKFLDKHPRMLEVNAQIADRVAAVADSAQQAAANLTNDYQRLRSESSELDTRLIEAENAARVYRDNLSRLAVLSQETRSREEVIHHLAARAAEQEVTANLDDLQLKLVDPPVAGAKPVGLPRLLMLVLAGAAAAITGAAVAVLADFLDRRLRGAAALARTLERPVLASVPLRPSGPQPVPAFDEAIRTLRTNLKFTLPARRGVVIAVAPVQRGDGATTIITQLALAIAAAGERVLLVDANLRHPGIAISDPHATGQGPGFGLSLLLAGEPGIAAVATPHANLHLLPAGALPPNPAELLNSHCLPEWLGQVRATYDLILIDGPALAEAADALIIADHCDGIVLVARDQVTITTEVDAARVILTPHATKLLGGVLNGVKPT